MMQVQETNNQRSPSHFTSVPRTLSDSLSATSEQLRDLLGIFTPEEGLEKKLSEWHQSLVDDMYCPIEGSSFVTHTWEEQGTMPISSINNPVGKRIYNEFRRFHASTDGKHPLDFIELDDLSLRGSIYNLLHLLQNFLDGGAPHSCPADLLPFVQAAIEEISRWGKPIKDLYLTQLTNARQKSAFLRLNEDRGYTRYTFLEFDDQGADICLRFLHPGSAYPITITLSWTEVPSLLSQGRIVLKAIINPASEPWQQEQANVFSPEEDADITKYIRTCLRDRLGDVYAAVQEHAHSLKAARTDKRM